MKSLVLVLACATLATSTAVRDKRSWTHAAGYSAPVSVHTVVRPSNTLPVYEYPESTQIDTLSKTVYSVSVPITHTVHLEQPEYSRHVIYHNPPAQISTYQPTYSYNTVQAPVYTPQVYTPHVYTPQVYTAPLQRRVYNVRSPWPYQRYASSWC